MLEIILKSGMSQPLTHKNIELPEIIILCSYL